MDPLSENITQAIADFDSIQDAIIEKGVSVPYGTPTSEYGDKIKAIETGGRVSPKDVNFYDYDGMLLHSWSLAEARAATTLPNGSVHDRLVFQQWNWSLSDINALIMPADVGATYTTASGASEFDITLTIVTGSDVALRTTNISGALTVDWGDGEVTTSDAVGLNSWAHSYTETGNYIISVDSTGTYFLSGTSSSPYNIFQVSPSYICTAARLGDRCTTVANYMFRTCRGLKTITVPSSITDIGSYPFYECYGLTGVVLPSSLRSLLNVNYLCYSLYTAKKIVLPNTITSMPLAALRYAYNLTSITVPSGITSIATYVFADCHNVVEYMFHGSTPPTLSNINAFSNINALCKIKVPRGSLEAYQAATNWATYADYMVEWGSGT